jgi:hemerythrin-like domain-containing protein
MTRKGAGHQRGDTLGPTDPRLLGNPLDFIAEDHLRERQVCTEMNQLSGTQSPDPDLLADILNFLIEELPMHLADEEQDLFPMMLQRCDPEDEIDRVIARLQGDHQHAKADTGDLIQTLRAAYAAQTPISADAINKLSDFAGKARRHLILENAIVLPIARKRLKPSDLDRMRANMMARRGLDRIFGGTGC